MLLQWIRHHILVFEERKFPTSYEEIEVNGTPSLLVDTGNTFGYLERTISIIPFIIQSFSIIQLKVLWRQFLKFKETELPAKEADKNRTKHIYKSLEVSFVYDSQVFVFLCHTSSDT